MPRAFAQSTRRAYRRIWAASGIAGLTILSLNVPAARGQATPIRLQFEVASVKPHATGDSGRVSIEHEPGLHIYKYVTVRGLMREAYRLKIYPLSRGPDALSTDRYDVIGKAPPDASREQVARMLQSLLEERFKLVVHRETKELPVYRLVAAKGGPKFHAVEDDGSAAEIGEGGGHQIKAHHASMELLAAALQGSVGDKVLDATGLTGVFDFNLDFNVDEGKPFEDATIFEAVQRQLGLKLEGGKGPVEVIVIDHVEKPSAN